jgi:peptidoglycan/xylan/chitin deacetylase (PgdA/CDA1 family)
MRPSPVKLWLKSLLAPTALVRVRGRPRAGKIALTFDDGPLDGFTDRVIDALRSRGHRATFFVVGQRANQMPTALERMFECGCEVGNHSYSHPRLSRLSLAEIAQEFHRTDSLVRSILGVTPRFLRPPFGELSVRLLLHLARHRATAALWSAEFGGYESTLEQTPDVMVKDFTESEIEAGEIVLLHDTNDSVVRELPRLLDVLDARGIRSVSLTELVS